MLTLYVQCVTIYCSNTGGGFMAKTDTLNIRIEPKLKKEVETTLDDLGLNIAEAVTIFLKQVVLTDSIPFMIKKPEFSNDMLEAIKEANKIMEKPAEYKKFNSVDELMEDLNSKDE